MIWTPKLIPKTPKSVPKNGAKKALRQQFKMASNPAVRIILSTNHIHIISHPIHTLAKRDCPSQTSKITKMIVVSHICTCKEKRNDDLIRGRFHCSFASLFAVACVSSAGLLLGSFCAAFVVLLCFFCAASGLLLGCF